MTTLTRQQVEADAFATAYRICAAHSGMEPDEATPLIDAIAKAITDAAFQALAGEQEPVAWRVRYRTFEHPLSGTSEWSKWGATTARPKPGDEKGPGHMEWDIVPLYVAPPRSVPVVTEGKEPPWRDCFAEITAKAMPHTFDPDDPERILSYVVPAGPIHRAAGKTGFQFFGGEQAAHRWRKRAERAEAELLKHGFGEFLNALNDELAAAMAGYTEAMNDRVIPAIEAAIQEREYNAAAYRFNPNPLSRAAAPPRSVPVVTEEMVATLERCLVARGSTLARTDIQAALIAAIAAQPSGSVLETSETMSGERMLTVTTKRGDEYVINADRLAVAFGHFLSERDNEKRFGWELLTGWYKSEFEKLIAAADPRALSAPPALSEERVGAGWVLERGDSPTNEPKYWAAGQIDPSRSSAWTSNHMAAIRFARQEDAQAVADRLMRKVPLDVRVCEHEWSRSLAAKKGEPDEVRSDVTGRPYHGDIDGDAEL